MKRLFVTNKSGKIKAVILPKKEYDRMKKLIEDFDDINIFDRAIEKIKMGEEQFVTFEEILKE